MSFGHQGLWGEDSPELAGAAGALVPRTGAHQAEGCLKPLLSVPSRSRVPLARSSCGKTGSGWLRWKVLMSGLVRRCGSRVSVGRGAQGDSACPRPAQGGRGAVLAASPASSVRRRSPLFVEWRSKQEDGCSVSGRLWSGEALGGGLNPSYFTL